MNLYSAPDHKSLLTDLVRRYTRMQVFEVKDGMEIQPNCTYIIPPNRDMALINRTLQLMEPSGHHPKIRGPSFSSTSSSTWVGRVSK